jgi:hypothetical protein
MPVLQKQNNSLVCMSLALIFVNGFWKKKGREHCYLPGIGNFALYSHAAQAHVNPRI